MTKRAHYSAVALPGTIRNSFQDVQEGIRETFGEDELLRQIAEVDQLDAKLRDDSEADIAEIEPRGRRASNLDG
jgi:hypothetical protein